MIRIERKDQKKFTKMAPQSFLCHWIILTNIHSTQVSQSPCMYSRRHKNGDISVLSRSIKRKRMAIPLKRKMGMEGRQSRRQMV